ncbi:MAG: permease [Candidatus Zixiibacteriota bacterium]|nr:MAG: permease [candidate division Zixibacteria bacterium]
MSLFLQSWAESIWEMMVDSAFLLFIGIILAGLISIVLNSSKIKDKIIGNGKSDIFKASVIGIPLPLCSCSVLPVAKQLRQSGVSKGATVSFLISTPESGVDSIMLTYTLMDPIMTLARPITAFITSISAGLLENKYDNKINNVFETVDTNQTGSACSCCCSSNGNKIEVENQSLVQKIISGIKYSFSDLLSDLAPFLLFGYLLAGLVSASLGGDLLSLSDTFTTGWGSYLGAVIIGVPLYICATSSTPLAAALLAIGFSPGAVLVFMMVGPATNITSLTVVHKILKGWSIIRYLLVIVVVAVACGIAVDYLYDYFKIAVNYQTDVLHKHNNWLDLISAIILSLFILYYSFKAGLKKLR